MPDRLPRGIKLSLRGLSSTIHDPRSSPRGQAETRFTSPFTRAPKPAAISTDEPTASCDGSDISTRSETSSAQPTGASSPRYTAASCAPFYALIGADEPAEPLTWTCGRCTLLNPLRSERCEACEFARAPN